MITRISLEPLIKGKIKAKSYCIGKGVIIDDDAEIIADELYLGDFCYIGKGVRLEVSRLAVGEYTKLHAGTFGYGQGKVSIGHCCWIGGGVVLDAGADLLLGEGVCVGSHSQLWTHMKAGDVVQGCRFNHSRSMAIGNDVWLVGHCLVAPCNIGDRSMAMLGSVVTNDIGSDRTYAGVPAKDMTDVFGTQFEQLSLLEKQARFDEIIAKFLKKHPELSESRLSASAWDVASRTYTKTYSREEVMFMRENVPLVKFYPRG